MIKVPVPGYRQAWQRRLATVAVVGVVVADSTGCCCFSKRHVIVQDATTRHSAVRLILALPEDIYQSCVLMKASRVSGDPLRRQPFMHALRKEIDGIVDGHPLGPFYLRPSDHLPYILANLSDSPIFLDRMVVSAELLLINTNASPAEVIHCRERVKGGDSTVFFSLRGPYEDTECLTILRPGERMIGVVDLEDIEGIPVYDASSGERHYELSLILSFFDTRSKYFRENGIHVLSGSVSSDSIQVIVIPGNTGPAGSAPRTENKDKQTVETSF